MLIVELSFRSFIHVLIHVSVKLLLVLPYGFDFNYFFLYLLYGFKTHTQQLFKNKKKSALKFNISKFECSNFSKCQKCFCFVLLCTVSIYGTYQLDEDVLLWLVYWNVSIWKCVCSTICTWTVTDGWASVKAIVEALIKWSTCLTFWFRNISYVIWLLWIQICILGSRILMINSKLIIMKFIDKIYFISTRNFYNSSLILILMDSVYWNSKEYERVSEWVSYTEREVE